MKIKYLHTIKITPMAEPIPPTNTNLLNICLSNNVRNTKSSLAKLLKTLKPLTENNQ